MAHATECLKKHAAFVPFSVVIMLDDTYRVYSSSRDQTAGDYQELLGQMAGLLGAAYENGQIRASALGVRVAAQMTPGELHQDTLLLELEHLDGSAMKYFIPIEKPVFGAPRLGKAVAAPHKRRFVPDPGQDG